MYRSQIYSTRVIKKCGIYFCSVCFYFSSIFIVKHQLRSKLYSDGRDQTQPFFNDHGFPPLHLTIISSLILIHTGAKLVFSSKSYFVYRTVSKLACNKLELKLCINKVLMLTILVPVTKRTLGRHIRVSSTFCSREQKCRKYWNWITRDDFSCAGCCTRL